MQRIKSDLIVRGQHRWSGHWQAWKLKDALLTSWDCCNNRIFGIWGLIDLKSESLFQWSRFFTAKEFEPKTLEPGFVFAGDCYRDVAFRVGNPGLNGNNVNELVSGAHFNTITFVIGDGNPDTLSIQSREDVISVFADQQGERDWRIAVDRDLRRELKGSEWTRVNQTGAICRHILSDWIAAGILLTGWSKRIVVGDEKHFSTFAGDVYTVKTESRWTVEVVS